MRVVPAGELRRSRLCAGKIGQREDRRCSAGRSPMVWPSRGCADLAALPRSARSAGVSWPAAKSRPNARSDRGSERPVIAIMTAPANGCRRPCWPRGAADDARDHAIPSGARRRAASIAAVEVLAEHEMVFPSRIVLQPSAVCRARQAGQSRWGPDPVSADRRVGRCPCRAPN